MQDNNKRLKRKVRNSYIISTVSIALVLFLLGSVGYLILNALSATDRMKERMTVYVMLKDGLREGQRDSVAMKLAACDGVRETLFVSKAEAAEEFREFVGSDFESFLQENPLPDSYEVRLHARMSDKETVARLEKEVSAWPEVDEVVYQKNVLEQITTNINKFNLILLLFGGALLVIAMILLNNTIRVTIFSKRYVISTMKLVGATRWFIMKPFLGSSVLHGIYAALIAGVMFVGMIVGLNEGLPEVHFIADQMLILWILVAMLVLGVLISFVFTAFAVRKFIRMHTNGIYLY